MRVGLGILGLAVLLALGGNARAAPTAGSIALSDVAAPSDLVLPLGDGKVSAEPRRGAVYSCRQHFFRPGGGADDVPWIHGDRWNPAAKPHVEGRVRWPQARFSVTVSGNERHIVGNGLPVGEITGHFPIRPSDPAYAYDRNPNSIRAHRIDLTLPRLPSSAATPTCLPMGMIGIALDGVPIFDALDDGGRDAVAHEVQDACNGHPQHRGIYHYHGPSPCVKGEDGRDVLIGYALDGFGIYSMRDAKGRLITDSQLDACHGMVGPVPWDGKMVTMYHYVLTRDYPYTLGCFRGRPVSAGRPRGGGQGGPPGMGAGMGPGMGGSGMARRGGGMNRRPEPPHRAIAACSGRSDGESCSFVTPRGNRIQGTCGRPRGNDLACMPQNRRPPMR